MTFPFPVFLPGAKNKATRNFTDHGFRGSGTTWNAGTRNLGASPLGKIIAVGCGTVGGSGNITGVSIAGIAATLFAGSGASGNIGIWAASVPPGTTTGNITITLSTTATRVAFAAWEILNAKQLSPYDVGAGFTASGASAGALVDVVAGGVAVAFARGNSTNNVLSLAGLPADITENVLENANNSYLGASDEFLADELNRSITASMTPNGSIGLAVASWEPAL